MPGFEYCVVSGDTLWGVARRYRVQGGWRAIWNHDRNEDLRRMRASADSLCVGDRVWIPEARGNVPSAPTGRRRASFTIPPPYLIRAEDGTSIPSSVIPVRGTLRLKAQHLEGDSVRGAWCWSTPSTKIRLSNETTDTVTITARNNFSASLGAETIRLNFTPEGQAGLPSVSHRMTVIRVRFLTHRHQTGGFDGMGTNMTDATPAGQTPHLSVKKNTTTRVTVVVEGGATGGALRFTSDDDTTAEADPRGSPPARFTLFVEGKSKNKAETNIRARAGSDTGPICATLKVNVYREKTGSAYVYKIQDNRSAGTRLRHGSLSLSEAQTEINGFYKPAIARVTINGSADVTNVRYDLDGNGSITLEPRQTTQEARAITSACTQAGQKIAMLRSMVRIAFLRERARRGETVIKLKTVYGNYVRQKIRADSTYQLSAPDGTGSENVEVDSVTNQNVTIKSALTRNHGTDHGIVRTVSGLSGNPIYVTEGSKTETQIKQTMGHELGHSLLNLDDLRANNNLMHYSAGRADTQMRYKEEPSNNNPGTNENQWQTIPRS